MQNTQAQTLQQTLFPITNASITDDRKTRTQRFYDAIKSEYLKLRNVKKEGVRLYSDEYILQTVGNKFFRSPKTIENIVFNRV